MRKVIALVIMSAMLLCAVSAEGQIRVTVMPEWFFITNVSGTSVEGSMGETKVYTGIEGANYFGENGGFGIEYGFSAMFPVNMWAEGTVIKADTFSNAGAALNIGAAYRHEFNNLLGLSAGLGVRFNIDSTMDTVAGENAIGPVFLMFDIYGRASVDVTIINHLRFNAGLFLGGPLFSVNLGADYDVSYSGLYLSPYVGVSYVY